MHPRVPVKPSDHSGNSAITVEIQEQATWVYLGLQHRHVERRRFRSLAQVLLLPTRELMAVPTVDISPGGVGFVSPLNLPLDLACEIRFRAPIIGQHVEMFVARGQVAYSVLSGPEGGFIIGLQFTDIAVSALALIREYVSQSAWPA
ncbi:PilZ domain-containing protein [Azohydromonas caseinilytica]|uniref:PilZ domain-containing protein n=1 Tax=Azohydromonas caseinilytica TaxID=2728836 RepID=A0A848FAL7_9BURK|nr:PilZ domain-containing protein [Azohydromonas caseinilytica]NML15795.1 PilZ domain-containing protein [Azohydromonas caseinilytica]